MVNVTIYSSTMDPMGMVMNMAGEYSNKTLLSCFGTLSSSYSIGHAQHSTQISNPFKVPINMKTFVQDFETFTIFHFLLWDVWV